MWMSTGFITIIRKNNLNMEAFALLFIYSGIYYSKQNQNLIGNLVRP